MLDLPSGTVTFLFTDIEGSTALWERDQSSMQAAVERHLELIHHAVNGHHGIVYKTVGDGTQAAFATAPDAVAGAVAAQRRMLARDSGAIGPLYVRMALHTGEAEPRDGDYLTAPLNRLARLLASGHGGQILVTQVVQQLVRGALPEGVELRDLGEHRLRDLLEPERIWQVLAPGLETEFPSLKTLGTHPNNLPRQPTPFLGREQEVEALAHQLRRDEVQLITLTGPGGTGKTRLALQAAAELLDVFPDGVYFVPLAPLTDPALVPSAIGSALGLRDEGAQSLPERLSAYCATRRLLLVLDNFEHLTEAATAVGDLLVGSPRLKVMVTSRTPLRLRAEREYPVPPLGLPDEAGETGAPAGSRRDGESVTREISTSAAVQLFVARAQAVVPTFALTDANAASVAEVCRRLDGLPLAIELAAARVRFLSPQAMLARLERRLTLLTGGSRDAPARQRTLRDTIAWSYDLLAAEEQALFRRLAVFAGGWTLEAAEAVADYHASLDVFNGVERLSEHSLLRQADGLGEEPRFSMLETIREYGLEQLGKSEEEATRAAHAAHFAALGDEAERDYRLRPGPFLAALEADADNLRAALGWAELRGEADLGLRLALAFGTFALRGALREGQEWYRRVLALDGGQPALRARALTGLGRLALFQGATEVALDTGAQAVQLAPAQSWIRGAALTLLGAAELDRGPSDRAREWFEQALDALRADPEGGAWVPGVFIYLGLAAKHQGDLAEARRQHEAALAALAPGDMPGVRAMLLGNLSGLIWEEGDRRRAAELAREALALDSELGNVSTLITSIENAADDALFGGQPEAAARLLGAAAAMRKETNFVVDPYNREVHEASLARTREALGKLAFAAAWREGESLPLEQAIAEADAVLAWVAQGDSGE
jgi:predicted ATPase/class 3 adenylate cyclase